MKLILNALAAWLVTSMSHNFISPSFETKEEALNNSEWYLNSNNSLYQNHSEYVPVCLFMSTVNGFDPRHDQFIPANESIYNNVSVTKKSLILSTSGYIWFTQLVLSLCPTTIVPNRGIQSFMTLDSISICSNKGICMNKIESDIT